jgi:hypothetical protein
MITEDASILLDRFAFVLPHFGLWMIDRSIIVIHDQSILTKYCLVLLGAVICFCNHSILVA